MRQIATLYADKTMLLPLAGLILGAALGAWRASRRGGKALDLAQWAAVHGVFGFIIGVTALIVITRMAS
ncbi:conserved hypothetical protein [Ketogulonicigenium vulgare Y25]|uniref:Uncharacterized protein n=2 Tax=Ketogulonicigenium vulgare TaxID=92945 RepID=F9Y9J7_KETVW|nr:conserved hypothetical protein [Ketogulonicigenium vulgare Y25]AEM41335.1 hypothetical protein KVU_1496 [Ketogulonicigenium vulgare WSH-001]ALJ81475.1 hypothetical protein KVH_09970 [Ketogulonicigenium vulgare]ANW35096.1 hypothetical protein KvSKV_09915 [Ketogulonicigenium vulgare]AOZ55076.1 hypothetical protein KVC_2069 [Ketogulonicigenium vulgare]